MTDYLYFLDWLASFSIPPEILKHQGPTGRKDNVPIFFLGYFVFFRFFFLCSSHRICVSCFFGTGEEAPPSRGFEGVEVRSTNCNWPYFWSLLSLISWHLGLRMFCMDTTHWSPFFMCTLFSLLFRGLCECIFVSLLRPLPPPHITKNPLRTTFSLFASGNFPRGVFSHHFSRPPLCSFKKILRKLSSHFPCSMARFFPPCIPPFPSGRFGPKFSEGNFWFIRLRFFFPACILGLPPSTLPLPKEEGCLFPTPALFFFTHFPVVPPLSINPVIVICFPPTTEFLRSILCSYSSPSSPRYENTELSCPSPLDSSFCFIRCCEALAGEITLVQTQTAFHKKKANPPSSFFFLF